METQSTELGQAHHLDPVITLSHIQCGQNFTAQLPSNSQIFLYSVKKKAPYAENGRHPTILRDFMLPFFLSK